MNKLLLALCLLLVATASATATPVDFKLVAGGAPVNWSNDNTVGYLFQPEKLPEFRADVPEGSSLFLGMYLLRNRRGVISSPSPGVKVQGTSVTVDVSPIDRSLRSAGALTWLAGKLYVAEPYSNDGANKYVYAVEADGALGQRLATVAHPRALAAGGKILYVAGDGGLAAYNPAKEPPLIRTVALDYGVAVGGMAVIGKNIYIGERSTPAVHIFDSETLTETGKLSGEGDAALKVTAGLSGLGVAATPKGTLLVSDSAAIREYDPTGKLLRTVVKVNNGYSLAVGTNGDIALGINSAKDPDYGYTGEVWVYDADGKPRMRMVRVYMSGPRPSPDWKLGYFGGLLGKLQSPGGVALDDKGRLLVSDSNDWPRDADHFYGTWKELAADSGIVRVTPDAQVDARYGSRFTNSDLPRRMAKEHAVRLPLSRTQAILNNGGKLKILVWGDSITQTGGDWNGGATKTANNWVYVLQRLIQEKYPAVTVAAEANGVGGQTAAEGLTRDPTPRNSAQPDLILLEFGTNEMGWHHYSPARYAAYMKDMITLLETLTDSDIAIVSPGPVFEHSEAPQAEYMAALKKVGREMNVPVVDIQAVMEAKLKAGAPFETYHMGPTNPHPNDAGHAIWAQAVLDAIALPVITPGIGDPNLLRNGSATHGPLYLLKR